MWRELSRVLEQANPPVSFWLRDDDAVEPSAALDRLLEFDAPVAVAVIPARAGENLAGRLRAAPHARAVVHGWSHQNHAGAGGKKIELGGDRSIETMLDELARSLARMRQLFGEEFTPMLVPPWNRIDQAVLPHLRKLGFTALSTYGAQITAPVPVINTHIDIMNWRGGGGSRAHETLMEEILSRIGNGPIGILTHHLVHDEGAWEFLEALFKASARTQWKRVEELIAHAP